MNPQTVESPVGTAGLIQLDFFPQIPVVVQPTGGQLTSDAGLLAIRQFDQRWNYTQRMAAYLADPNPQRGQSLISMLRQRVFGVLAGYEDCNDHDTLRDDPVFKLIAERLPGDAALASQPTLSRFENLATPRVLQKLIDFNIATGIERLQAASRRPAPRRDHAGPRRHRRSHPRPSATDVLPRLLRPVPILPPDYQRADHQACVCRGGCGPARCMPPSAPMMTSCGWSRPCGSNGPTSSYMCVPTPASACPGCTRSANKTTSPTPSYSPPTPGSRHSRNN